MEIDIAVLKIPYGLYVDQGGLRLVKQNEALDPDFNENIFITIKAIRLRRSGYINGLCMAEPTGMP
jgi:hypothetical protein